jgi:RNA polymerase sigma-70 factor, ECF subfamily
MQKYFKFNLIKSLIKMRYDISEIYKTYSPRIVLYLSRFVGRDDAEDLMQEVFIKVFNSLHTFKEDSKISTWIYKIATNTAVDKLKSAGYKKDKLKTTSLDYVEPLKSKEKDFESDIEYNFLKQEMNQCIADYINKLQDNYRAIFLLKEYDDLTISQIAKILDISDENVKIRLHRARKKLHESLLANCSFYYDEYSILQCDKK